MQTEQNQRVATELVNACIQMVGDKLFKTIYEEYTASRALKEDDKPVQDEKPKKTTKQKKTTEEKKEKRIPRMTAAYLKQLQSQLVKANVDVNFDDKKEVEKIKKSFLAYIDDLTEDDFKEKKIPVHMEDFANLQTKQEEKKEEEEKADETIHELTLTELQAIEKLAENKDFAPGVYWDGDNGRKVTGPDPDNDEEDVTVKFEKKRYIVGKTTGRIHNDDDDQDFVGYVGVLRFKEMKMPKEDE
jgi:hypothetical protein